MAKTGGGWRESGGTPYSRQLRVLIASPWPKVPLISASGDPTLVADFLPSWRKWREITKARRNRTENENTGLVQGLSFRKKNLFSFHYFNFNNILKVIPLKFYHIYLCRIPNKLTVVLGHL